VRKRGVLLGAVIVLIAVLLGIALLLFRPVGVRSLTSNPNPTTGYAEAVERIEALRDQQASQALNPLCQLQFMTHGQKAEKAIVFVHGYTNCPQQFRELGEQFYDLGYNVLIVPAPHHGLADRMTTEHARLTAEELAAYTDSVVDIAQGLGEHVSLAGISMGGIATAWAAQHRNDLDLAVLISPAFGFQMIPAPVTAPAVNAFLVLPNFYQWTDSTLKEENGPAYTYPRRSTRALAQTLRFGLAVQALREEAPPAAGSILVITNAGDPSVDNALTAEVVAAWREWGAEVATYEFAADLELEHDLIDPSKQTQPIVYPRLVELITGITAR
jgi:alpha-beta hydrolase superfamily lysophospholipase